MKLDPEGKGKGHKAPRYSFSSWNSIEWEGTMIEEAVGEAYRGGTRAQLYWA